jgi:hypothetical protein
MNKTVDDQSAGREPSAVPPIVDGLAPGESVTILGITYTAPADDGPGRDQHGRHDAPTLAQRLVETPVGPRGAEHILDDGMVGPAYRVEHAPPATDPELETRVRNTIYLVEQSSINRKFAARQIIATVREHDAAATRYTDRLTFPADDLDAPSGPKWQVLDAKDEETWHDITALVECEDPDCTVSIDDEVECVVVRSSAYSGGFGHFPADAMVDVRIPASRGAQA